MKILVTGNMGYVGPRVVARLRAAFPSATLAGLDTGLFAGLLTGTTRLPECLLDSQIFCDVRSVPDDALRGVDHIVHLAAISNDPIGERYGDATMEINRAATTELARRAKDAGVKSFVFASSCSVYGTAEAGARTEASAVNPLTAYARSKVEAERDLEALAGPAFRVSCLRFGTACGMSERLRLDLVLNDFVASAVAAGRITILSDGTSWRPLIDVDDMARAIEWALQRGGESYLVVNVGSDDANYQIRELAEAVRRVIPETAVSINSNASPDKRSYKVDFGLFRRLAPDHQPVKTLDSTIHELRDGVTAMRYDCPDVRQSPYIRLRTISSLQESGALSPLLRWSA
jgi:nucleoside-diphosphate-sugar epimerase